MPKKNTGSLELRNGVYHTRVSRQVNKKRERGWVSLETGDLDIARKKRARLIADIKAGKVNPFPSAVAAVPAAPSAMPGLGDYARTWVAKRIGAVASAESERINLEKYVFPVDVGGGVLLGGLLLGDIRILHVRTALERARDMGRSRQTVSHIRAALRRVLQSAVEEELIPVNVAAQARVLKMREVKRKRLILSDADIDRFFGHDDGTPGCLEIRILGLTSRTEGGMRTRDLTAWDWTMIDTSAFALCTIPRTKTQAPQTLEIPLVLRTPLRQWWVSQGRPTTGPVFPVTKGKRVGEARRARGVSFAKRLRRTLMAAGVKRHDCERPDVSPTPKAPCCSRFASDPLYFPTAATMPVDFHSFRRAYSTGLAAAGVNAQHAMLLAGHADPRAHARYVMETEEMRRVPLAALPRLNGHRMATDAEAAPAPIEDPQENQSGKRGSNPRPSAWEADDRPGTINDSAQLRANRGGGSDPLILGGSQGPSGNGHGLATGPAPSDQAIRAAVRAGRPWSVAPGASPGVPCPAEPLPPTLVEAQRGLDGLAALDAAEVVLARLEEEGAE